MRDGSTLVVAAAAVAWVLATPSSLLAQSPFTAADEDLAERVWGELLAREPDRPASELVSAWLDHPDIRKSFLRDEIVSGFVHESRAAGVDAAMAKDQARLARSFNAAASTARKVGLLERSGLVDRVALAVEGTNFVSADDTAVTLNLNAAALLVRCGGKETHTPAYEYECGARHVLNRLGGSFTFGAEIPKKELTGFSGLPDAHELFDAVAWDVKLRLFGDRNPRARRWWPLLFGELGSLMGKASNLVASPSTPAARREEVVKAVHAEAQRRTDLAVERIKRSLQVSLKASGQHLTTVTGMNKYAVSLLVDKGFPWFDGALNASYSVVQDVSVAGTVVDLKQWKLTGGLAGTLWPDALVDGRGSVLTLSGELLLPTEEGVLKRRNVWRADLALTLPVTDSAQIPVSITYTNDPNNLTNQSYVRGQVGINYDFGSLKKMLSKGK